MKYEAPKMQMIEISANDVIKTSPTGGDATGNVGGGGDIED